MTDIEIARNTKLYDIKKIAKNLGRILSLMKIKLYMSITIGLSLNNSIYLFFSKQVSNINIQINISLFFA